MASCSTASTSLSSPTTTSMSLRPRRHIAGARYLRFSLVPHQAGPTAKSGTRWRNWSSMRTRRREPARIGPPIELAYGGDDEYVCLQRRQIAWPKSTPALPRTSNSAMPLAKTGMKKLRELEADCVAEHRFRVVRHQSCPELSTSTEWVKAAPDFWKPKHAPAATAARPQSLRSKQPRSRRNVRRFSNQLEPVPAVGFPRRLRDRP